MAINCVVDGLPDVSVVVNTIVILGVVIDIIILTLVIYIMICLLSFLLLKSFKKHDIAIVHIGLKPSSAHAYFSEQ